VQKILVIQTAFIGDVVLASGLLEKLHASFPEAAIDLLVRKGNEALLAGHPFLHELLVWDKKEGKFRNLFRLLRRIRGNKYDKVINVQRFLATGFLTAFSGARERIGFDKNPLSFLFSRRIPHIVSTEAITGASPTSAPGTTHEIQRNHTLIREFTDPIPGRPRLYPSRPDYDKVGVYKHRAYLTLSPASVWFTKQYPKEKWISFIKRLPASYTLYLLGAPSDNPLCEEIRTGAGHALVINLSGQLSFLQSAALMADAVMNYVNDSAPMHFASSVNAPVTAIYCSTIPAFGFGPLSDKSFVVELQQPLDCRPCGLHGYRACPKGHFHCAWWITEEQLLASLPKEQE
jgi:ADP-heptose:LPS heptosyltransferase